MWDAQVARIAGVVNDIVGNDLVGAYLYGSAVMGLASRIKESPRE